MQVRRPFLSRANTRRSVLKAAGAALLLSACGRRDAGAAPPNAALKDVAPFPVGACVITSKLRDPAYADLLLRQFSQVTPEWEMKMERILADDGSFRFDAADAIAAFAKAHGLRLHGTTLAWHAQKPAAFERIAGDPKGFAAAYRNYITTVAGRYRGVAVGWDVVNEPIAEDGAYRDCLWSRALGMDYAALAFRHAREADPDAVLFLNDYNLESNPAKLAGFQRLAESLLKQGVPLTGLGTQTHLGADTAKGTAGRAIKSLASFGLPIHVSELDVTTHAAAWRPGADVMDRQARVVGEVAEAFMGLPKSQRYAITIWGVRDSDSWLRHSPYGGADDAPVLFDDAGGAKPAFDAFVSAARG